MMLTLEILKSTCELKKKNFATFLFIFLLEFSCSKYDSKLELTSDLYLTCKNALQKHWSLFLGGIEDIIEGAKLVPQELITFFVFFILGMTGNYLLTNPLLRPHGTNNPYNTLLAETVVCNTPTAPVFNPPGVLLLNSFVLCHSPYS